MTYVARIKNENGEKQIFMGESPSLAAKELVNKTSLEGKIFSITIAHKRFFRNKHILISREIENEELPDALNCLLQTTRCLECPLFRLCHSSIDEWIEIEIEI